MAKQRRKHRITERKLTFPERFLVVAAVLGVIAFLEWRDVIYATTSMEPRIVDIIIVACGTLIILFLSAIFTKHRDVKEEWLVPIWLRLTSLFVLFAGAAYYINAEKLSTVLSIEQRYLDGAAFFLFVLFGISLLKLSPKVSETKDDIVD